ncbi:hypothetical protein [Aestuariivirga litoralis]|uniref:hypothetical protein n=1 Tax=Aestuariivirga litoralis TaxID=2650924 RepID=UPI0011B85CE7|nr:hypothetical protein [Aestuariivirga litoralis]
MIAEPQLESLCASLDDSVCFEALVTGDVHWFADWPCGDVPRSGSIVYSIWNRSLEFIYVGMSGRGPTVGGGQKKGPWGRINSHASGKRSGDQFCVYVHDFLVIHSLHNRLEEVKMRTLSLDQATRSYIRENFGFRWMAAASGTEALRIERLIQRGKSPLGLPLLNPLP